MRFLGLDFLQRRFCVSFAGLPLLTIPFLIANYQSKYIARVFAGRCQLPDSQAMVSEIDNSIQTFKKANGSLKYAAVALSGMLSFSETLGDTLILVWGSFRT